MRALAALAAVLAATPGAAADAVRGETLWKQQCSGCHAVDGAKVGPPHRGVVGRPAGSVAGFAYSPALKAEPAIWTPERLNLWLADPGKLIPGTRMRLRVPAVADRADIVAFLETLD